MYCHTNKLTYLCRSSDKCDVSATSGLGCRFLIVIVGAYALGGARGAPTAWGASAARLLRIISCLHRVSSVLHATA